MSTCWLIRAGERSRHAARFASENVVAIGWPDVEGLGDLRSLDAPEIKGLLRAAGATARLADSDAAELLAFRDVVALGDVVIAPDGPMRDVLIGEITGEYDYLDPSPCDDFHHVRTVRWYGRVAKDALPAELEQDTKYRRTLRRLETHDEEWSAIAKQAEADGGPIVTRRTPATRKSSSRSASAIAEDRVRRRCPQCGMQLLPNFFIPTSELCIDCRAA
jgi:predicted Mrr-cat superfamily restriction endonuclease